jgi:hypothetical protein
MAYTHNTQAWVEWNIFLWLGLSNFNFLTFLVSCKFCIFKACLGFSLLKYMSFLCVYHVCITFEEEKHGLICSFLLIFESYIEGAFMLFLIMLYLHAFSYL